ncbi:MAG: HDOD domain-containing protein [Candidatus Krumholzibacteria bacterium]|nr:HDOD domain-containing protein [Candidatus Krumholzibacteria bacterium]
MLNIFKKKRPDSQGAMKDLLGNLELQSFPSLIMEVLSDLRDPNQSLGVVAGKLEGDPGMTVKILRTVNAAAFGLSREVTNLHTAVSMTGHVRLETILLAHAVKGALPFAKAPNFSMKQFWVTASQRACLARAVAKRLHPATQVESFTAGLLQDMAVPVLIRQRSEVYAEILAAMQDRSHWLHELESDHFSFDHTDLGGHMARQWRLPGYLVDAISCHHLEEGEEGVALEPGVRMASMIRYDTDGVALEPLIEMAKREYDLDEKTMNLIISSSLAEAEVFANQIA